MGYLSRNDVAGVLDCVRELYEYPAHADFPHIALSILSNVIAADGVLYGSINGPKGTAMHISYPVWEFEKRSLLAFGEYMHQHPALRHLLPPVARVAAERKAKAPEVRDAFSRPLMAGRAALLSDAFSKRQYYGLEVFNEALKPLGIQHQLGTNFNQQNGLADVIAFCRTSKDFNERDRQIFDLLIPHIVQSMNNHNAFNALRHELAMLETITGAEDFGVFSVADDGKLKFRNGKAQQQFSRHFSSGLDGKGRLPNTVMKWFHGLTKVFKGGDIPATTVKPFCAEVEGSRLLFRFGGFQRGGEMTLYLEKRPATARLEGHRLTPREAEVLHWVAEGKSNKAISEILGMADGTVKKHLEHIYQKLAVENRMAAALMVMETAKGITP